MFDQINPRTACRIEARCWAEMGWTMNDGDDLYLELRDGGAISPAGKAFLASLDSDDDLVAFAWSICDEIGKLGEVV